MIKKSQNIVIEFLIICINDMEFIINCILENKEWLFSGLGVTLLAFVAKHFMTRDNNNKDKQTQLQANNQTQNITVNLAQSQPFTFSVFCDCKGTTKLQLLQRVFQRMLTIKEPNWQYFDASTP